jgi:2,3-diketo-5-methylthio-1-phosphopentane phosphatase
VSRRRAFLCDFDGTISPADIGAAFMRRFSTGSEADSAALLDRWRAGEIGSRELTAIECRSLVVSRSEALEFSRQFPLDPDFAPFVAEALARGDAVAVVSDGLDFYVRDHLERAGLDLPWMANVARFENGGMIPEFAEAGGCGRCGNCKAVPVERYREQGFEVVLIGDGLSDRCGARNADRVLARGELLRWCEREGLAAGPIEGFADVLGFARRWAANGPRSAGAGEV